MADGIAPHYAFMIAEAHSSCTYISSRVTVLARLESRRKASSGSADFLLSLLEKIGNLTRRFTVKDSSASRNFTLDRDATRPKFTSDRCSFSSRAFPRPGETAPNPEFPRIPGQQVDEDLFRGKACALALYWQRRN